jgi:hypothetical protein
MKYHVEDLKEPMNKLVCTEDDFRNYTIMVQSTVPLLDDAPSKGNKAIWKMHFDGA